MKTMCRVVFVTLLMTRLTVGQEEWLTPPLDVMLDGMPGIPASLAKFASNFRTGFSDAFLGWDPVKPEPLFVRRTYTDWQFLKGGHSRGKTPVARLCSWVDEGNLLSPKWQVFRS